MCGQYPGIVPRGATVKLECNVTVDLPQARYVVVQFPVTTDPVRLCEVEVYTPEGRAAQCRYFVCSDLLAIATFLVVLWSQCGGYDTIVCI